MIQPLPLGLGGLQHVTVADGEVHRNARLRGEHRIQRHAIVGVVEDEEGARALGTGARGQTAFLHVMPRTDGRFPLPAASYPDYAGHMKPLLTLFSALLVLDGKTANAPAAAPPAPDPVSEQPQVQTACGNVPVKRFGFCWVLAEPPDLLEDAPL